MTNKLLSRQSTYFVGATWFAWLLISSQSWAVQAPTPAENPTVVVQLDHVDAQTAQQILYNLFDDQGSLKSTIEPLSNSLVLRGTADQLQKIDSFLHDLDWRVGLAIKDREDELATATSPSNSKGVSNLETMSSDSPPLEQLRAKYQQLEADAQKLADEIRQAQRSSDSDRQELANVVEQAFDARLLLQRAELSLNAQRLTKIQQTLETRVQLKTQIVQRRVDELLKPKGPTATKTTEPSETIEAPVPPAERAQPWLSARNKKEFEMETLLRLSPHELRALLQSKRQKLSLVEDASKQFQSALANESDDQKRQKLQASIEANSAAIATAKKDLEFAALQHEQTVSYLETNLQALERLAATMREEEVGRQEQFESGRISRSELNAAATPKLELQMEVNRIEALLKLYRAAGDMPETKTDVENYCELMLTFKDQYLSQPRWVIGNCNMTNNAGGTHILAKAKAGTFARFVFEKISDHAGAELLLKFDVDKSLDESVKKRGLENIGSLSLSLEPKFSIDEVQAALQGESQKRRYVLRSDLTVDEKAVEEANDIVVCTLELSRP